MIRAILAFFGWHGLRDADGGPTVGDLPVVSITKPKRQLTLVAPQHIEPAAEVDNLRERYSAKAYVAHLKAAMNGDRKGFCEWSRVIHAMSPDDARLFYAEVDGLIEIGELVHVLTPEQVEEARAKLMANIEEWRAQSNGLMHDKGIPAALMHAVTNNDDSAEADMIALLDDMDEADALAWAEDDDDLERVGENLFAVTVDGQRRHFTLYTSAFACTEDELGAYWTLPNKDVVDVPEEVPKELIARACRLRREEGTHGKDEEEDQDHVEFEIKEPAGCPCCEEPGNIEDAEGR
jgi:hypothetical protein